MNGTEHDLDDIATKGERAQSRRLALARGLSEQEALRLTLELKAGKAGLPALVETRSARQAAQAGRDAARATLQAARAAAPAAAAAGSGRTSAPAWRAWFDGSARPNPGRCGIGALLLGPGGVRVEISRPAGMGDSSEAEYRALIALLEAALAHGAHGLAIHGDSQVVIGDVTGHDVHAAPALATYRRAALDLLARIPDARLSWIPRHRNHEADALSQRAVERLAAQDTQDTHADADN